jgi:EmrB/QacA subfamily drug resistance transporter
MDVCRRPDIRSCALIVSLLSSFIPPFMSSSINIALPAIGGEFSLNAILLGWIATSYLLAAAVFMVPFGKLADIYGMKRIFIYGLACHTFASLLAAFSSSSELLIASRILQGIGAAMIFGSGTAILVHVFPLRERGRVLGINASSVYLGLTAGPFLGGLLTEYLGWRSLFLVNVPLGLIPLLIALWKLEGEWAEAREERFDLSGSIIYSFMLVSAMYGFSRLPDPVGLVLVAVALCSLLVLVSHELRAPYPVLDLRLFIQNRVYAFSNLAALLSYSSTFSVGFLLSLYLQYIKGLQPEQAGLILLAQPAVMTLFSPTAGRLSDRIEPRVVASAGMALTVVALLLLSLLDGLSSTGFILACLAVLGLGLALFVSPNTNAIMSSLEKRHYGVGSATLGTMRLVGQVTSMGIAMLVFSIYLGKAEIMPQNYPQFLISMKAAFLISGLLCLAGVFASLARGAVRE